MLARFGLLALCASTVTADNYAVLVCGSNEYENYRHHADIAHAYQILTEGGYKKENIITMMYDDVPHSKENPYPGKLYNKPAKKLSDANEVYASVKDHIDYKGKHVTVDNFLAVLAGNSAGNSTNGKKVLTSGPDDNVFLYFADHGGPGVICMPDGGTPCGGLVHVKDLLKTFKAMHANKMYKQLVFYLEACESGSMFEHLPTDINIYAVSASNAKKSSYGNYCDGAKVGDVTFETCLGDLFSTNFLENDDVSDLTKETLHSQYHAVKKLTSLSPVLQWGDLSMDSEDASVFEGAGHTFPGATTAAHSESSMLDSRDIKLQTYYNQYIHAAPADRSRRAAKLAGEIAHREAMDTRFGAIAAKLSLPADLESVMDLKADHTCWKAAHEAVKAHCGTYTDYSLKHAKVVAAACNLKHSAAEITAAVKAVCL